MHVVEAGLDQQWVELPADRGVPACAPLQLDLAMDRGMGIGVVGMEVRRAVVAFDEGEAPTGSEQSAEGRERLDRSRQVLQDEADEDMVEGPDVEGQPKDVRLLHLHVAEPCLVDPAPGLLDRPRRSVDRGEHRPGAASCQVNRLGTHTAAGLQHPVPVGVRRTGVQQVGQDVRLVPQPLVLLVVVAVDVGVAHVADPTMVTWTHVITGVTRCRGRSSA